MPQRPGGRQAPKKPPLSPQQVARAIQIALGPRGSIFPSRHFRERSQGRNFTMQDAVVALEGGRVAARAKWNKNTGTWNYDVHGTDVDGEPLTVRMAVEPPRSIILVTAF